MPYWCTDCRSYFSVKTGTVMQASKLLLRKWAIGIYIYLCLTSLKSVSSMKLRAPWKGAFFWRVRSPPNNCRSGW